MKNNMEAILRIINSDPELKAKFETAVDNYCNSREWQLILAWKTKKHNLTGDQLEALTFALEWADSHTNWISVEDELPKNRELVFITDGEYTDTGFYDYTDDAWQPCEKWLGSITHWMPRPVPPEHIADVSKMISSSEFPNNCEKGDEQ